MDFFYFYFKILLVMFTYILAKTEFIVWFLLQFHTRIKTYVKSDFWVLTLFPEEFCHIFCHLIISYSATCPFPFLPCENRSNYPLTSIVADCTICHLLLTSIIFVWVWKVFSFLFHLPLIMIWTMGELCHFQWVDSLNCFWLSFVTCFDC